VGRTPYRLELWPGSYRVALVAGDGQSFPHKVTAGRDEVLQVDMAFEAGVAPQPPLCVTASDDDRLPLRLGPTVAAEQTVVVRNVAARGNPPYVTGALYDARGERVRNAGVRTEQLGDLVLYLFTGKPDIGAAPVVPPQQAVAAAPPATDRPALPRVAPPTPSAPAVGVAGSTAPYAWVRPASWVSLGVGVALGVAGGVVYAIGEPGREQLASLRQANGGRLPADATEGLVLLDAAAANRAQALTLLGTGAGALIAGAVGLALFPAAEVRVAAGPIAAGAAVSLSGSF
jgi:hypothetical protein